MSHPVLSGRQSLKGARTAPFVASRGLNLSGEATTHATRGTWKLYDRPHGGRGSSVRESAGLRGFPGRVEKNQIARLENAPELFEKYLPYAMALRVEKKWVAAFSNIGMQSPQWYQVAGGSIQPSLFVNDLGMMSSQAGSVMTSSSRSSGGGSSSGATSGSGFSDSGSSGGSSGGGFGGGGGGGF
jgi:hypothetical protein